MKGVNLIVGLGNPGDKYKHTRHNVGFYAIDYLAEAYSISIKKQKFDAMIGRGIIENMELILAKPMSYMNLSGYPVFRIASYYGISGKDMLVIHDDIDLAFGRIKIKEKGGDGGHKGIRSLIEVFGGGNFARVRIGVGRSENSTSVVNHVLGEFIGKETKLLDQIISRTRDAVITFLHKGITECMNAFNNKRLEILS